MFMVSIGHVRRALVYTHVALGHRKQCMEGIWY